jgi:hypothetical protein
MRLIVLLLCLLFVTPHIPTAQAQTSTPPPAIHATMEGGQQTRFDYIVRAGQVYISNLLTLLLFTVWAFFLLGVIALTALYRRQEWR